MSTRATWNDLLWSLVLGIVLGSLIGISSSMQRIATALEALSK
jgi:hypothetical protein